MKKVNWVVVGAIILAIGLRFWDYSNRWVLNQDQARDATIALYALKTNQIPPLGSPSSAGPFNFGPWYDWIIMVATKLSFGLTTGPWMWFTFLSATSVVAYYLTGRNMWGKRGGIIAGLIAAVAVGQVENAMDMLNTVLVGWSSAWAIFFLSKMVEEKRIRWGWFGGFLVGLSINFHFQAWGLMTLLGAAFLINEFDLKKKIAAGMVIGLGWLTTFLPLIVFDVQRNGAWVRSVIWYYTEGVKKFYVPVRWLTEIRDFWPRLFGSVITGTPEWGYVVVGIIFLVLLVTLIKRKREDKVFWMLLISLLIQVVMMRFYKGVRSREYLIAFHGYIVFLAAWAINNIIEWKKWMGVGILALLLIAATAGDLKVVQQKSQAKEILEMNKKIGEGEVDIYQTKGAGMVSLPIFYLRYHDNLVRDGGKKILICDEAKGVCPKGMNILAEEKTYKIFDVGDNKIVDFEKFTPELIYGWLWINYGKR